MSTPSPSSPSTIRFDSGPPPALLSVLFAPCRRRAYPTSKGNKRSNTRFIPRMCKTQWRRTTRTKRFKPNNRTLSMGAPEFILKTPIRSTGIACLSAHSLETSAWFRLSTRQDLQVHGGAWTPHAPIPTADIVLWANSTSNASFLPTQGGATPAQTANQNALYRSVSQ